MLSSISILFIYDIELCDFQIPVFYLTNLFAFSENKTDEHKTVDSELSK